MRKIWLTLALLVTVRALSGEEELPPLKLDSPLASPIAQEKTFLYGSLSLASGIGVSDRTRTGSKGNALDYKVGIAYIPFDTVHAFPVLSVDYNFLHFFKPDKEISPYVSYGIGAIYFIPYVPLRAGIQFPSGFLDLGAKMILGCLPCPEVRGGINLKF